MDLPIEIRNTYSAIFGLIGKFIIAHMRETLGLEIKTKP